jgi:hypothetical protein
MTLNPGHGMQGIDILQTHIFVYHHAKLFKIRNYLIRMCIIFFFKTHYSK